MTIYRFPESREFHHRDERLPMGTCIAIWAALDLALICSIVFIVWAICKVLGIGL